MPIADPLRPFELCVWMWWPLSWLYQRRVDSGKWYVKLDGSEAQLAHEAMRHILPSYRWLRRSVSRAKADELLGHRPTWREVKAQMRSSERICPFLINPWTSGMRAGYIVVRRGAPLAVFVAVVS